MNTTASSTVKNRSAASNRSPSPCQVETRKFSPDSNDSDADPTAGARRARQRWRSARLVPGCRPARHSGGWQPPACPRCFWSRQLSGGCRLLPCPAPRGQGCPCPGAFASKARAAAAKPGRVRWHRRSCPGGSRRHRQRSVLSRSGR